MNFLFEEKIQKAEKAGKIVGQIIGNGIRFCIDTPLLFVIWYYF